MATKRAIDLCAAQMCAKANEAIKDCCEDMCRVVFKSILEGKDGNFLLNLKEDDASTLVKARISEDDRHLHRICVAGAQLPLVFY